MDGERFYVFSLLRKHRAGANIFLSHFSKRDVALYKIFIDVYGDPRRDKQRLYTELRETGQWEWARLLMRTLWQLGNSEKTPRNSSSATVIRGAIKCKTRDGRVDDKVLWSSFPIVHSINAPPLRNSRGGGIRTRQLRMLILARSLRVSAAVFIIIISSVGSCLQGERHKKKMKKSRTLSS